MRGEYEKHIVELYHNLGSPPQAWRIHQSRCSNFFNWDITSTGVENTHAINQAKNSAEDHLHRRGEYSHCFLQVAHVLGSPPHAWRIPVLQLNRYTNIGITSTCVENTSWLPCRQIQERDHLHMRGEYWFIQSISIVFQGSPPHAWRIPAVGTKNTAQLGITSTCVENTYDLIARF